MSLIKISPGAKLTDANIARNVQIGGNPMIDNQGEIEGGNIEHNLYIPNTAQIETKSPEKQKFVDTFVGRIIIGLVILAIAGSATFLFSLV